MRSARPPSASSNGRKRPRAAACGRSRNPSGARGCGPHGAAHRTHRRGQAVLGATDRLNPGARPHARFHWRRSGVVDPARCCASSRVVALAPTQVSACACGLGRSTRASRSNRRKPSNSPCLQSRIPTGWCSTSKTSIPPGVLETLPSSHRHGRSLCPRGTGRTLQAGRGPPGSGSKDRGEPAGVRAAAGGRVCAPSGAGRVSGAAGGSADGPDHGTRAAAGRRIHRHPTADRSQPRRYSRLRSRPRGPSRKRSPPRTAAKQRRPEAQDRQAREGRPRSSG